MIGIVDYGAGNLKSVCNALDRLKRSYRPCRTATELAAVETLVLPGVGQFASAMRHLRAVGLDDAVRSWGRAGRPLLGICLGLQLLFESSAEAPGEPGLGLIPGHVVGIDVRVTPHMGWNCLQVERESAWLSGADEQHFYFAHSFAAAPTSPSHVSAAVRVDDARVAAVVESGALRGVQFHPEKSGVAGAELLERMVAC